MNINVLGGGTWGTALAYLADSNNHNVTLWLRDKSKADKLCHSRVHENLTNFKIPETVKITHDKASLDLDAFNILAVPTDGIINLLNTFNLQNSKLILACKGFEIESKKFPYDILIDQYNLSKSNISILSGPNHAEDVVLDKATATVVASTNSHLSLEVQALLSNENFRTYSSEDVYGVLIGGAIKNIIAIASGLSKGLNLGDNAQAALVSRGITEMLKLKNIYNFKDNTLFGLSGLGDLICTAYSKYSRNRLLGELFIKNKSLEESNNKIKMVSEGLNSSIVLSYIINNNNLDMPICKEVYRILFEGYNPEESLKNLMLRDLKREY